MWSVTNDGASVDHPFNDQPLGWGQWACGGELVRGRETSPAQVRILQSPSFLPRSSAFWLWRCACCCRAPAHEVRWLGRENIALSRFGERSNEPLFWCAVTPFQHVTVISDVACLPSHGAVGLFLSRVTRLLAAHEIGHLTGAWFLSSSCSCHMWE